MLEADICYKEQNHDPSSQASTRTPVMISGHRASPSRTRGKLVTHDRFLSEYWPHFSQILTKKLSKSSFCLNFNISLCPKTRRQSLARSSVSCSLSYIVDAINNLLHPGVISGSERTATLESGYLDRDAYENSTLRAQSTFAGHHSRIYDIFVSYRKRKMKLGDFDAAERLAISVPLRLYI